MSREAGSPVETVGCKVPVTAGKEPDSHLKLKWVTQPFSDLGEGMLRPYRCRRMLHPDHLEAT